MVTVTKRISVVQLLLQQKNIKYIKLFSNDFYFRLNFIYLFLLLIFV
jgi:hypothetical protein